MTEITAYNPGYITAQNLGTDLYTRWIQYIDATEKTKQTYNRAIKQFFTWLKDNGISQPVRNDVIQFKADLMEDHKPTTVQSYLAAVKIFFKWTAQEGVYPNIADHIKGVKLDTQHKKDYLTSTQTASLLSNIDRTSLKGLRDYALLSLMVTTGLRTISIIEARIGDIRTAGDSTVLYYKGKGHTEKAVYVKLAAPVEEAIRAYLKARGVKDPEAPLFASIAHRNGGEPMTTKSISRICKENLIDAGLESDRLTAHSLRHTAATLNLLNGGSLEETQQLLGHTSINTTMIYSHALERETNNSEARIAAAIFG